MTQTDIASISFISHLMWEYTKKSFVRDVSLKGSRLSEKRHGKHSSSDAGDAISKLTFPFRLTGASYQNVFRFPVDVVHRTASRKQEDKETRPVACGPVYSA